MSLVELNSLTIGAILGAAIAGAILWWGAWRRLATNARTRLMQLEADLTALAAERDVLREQLRVSRVDASRESARLALVEQLLVQRDDEIKHLSRLVQQLRNQVTELESAEQHYVSGLLDKALDRAIRRLSGKIVRYHKQKGVGFLRGPENAEIFFNVRHASTGVKRSLGGGSGQVSRDGFIHYDRPIFVWFEVRQVRGEPKHFVAGKLELRVPQPYPHPPIYEQGRPSGEVTVAEPDLWREQE
jgi:hypothetical protein